MRPPAGASWALAAAFVAGCGGNDPVEVIKLAHGLDPSHPVHEAMEFMAERVWEQSGGTLRIDIYPSEQLGSERENLELLQIGSLGMTKVSTNVLEGFAPEFRIFGLPYLFEDDAHRFRVLDGPLGQELLTGMERYRLRGLTYYDAGSRSFYTVRRPIRTPEDLGGLKIRTQESAVAMETVSALGASATPVAWGEVYTALQQEVVDGAENNPPSFHLSRHYEVSRYLTLDEHSSAPDVLLISSLLWERFTPEQRGWLEAAATESAELQRRLWKTATENALKEVRAAGVEVIRPDKAAFAARAQPVHARFRSDPVLGPMLEEIERTR